jgi:hypothetical protein
MSRETEIKKRLLDKLMGQMDEAEAGKFKTSDEKFNEQDAAKMQMAAHVKSETEKSDEHEKQSGEGDPSPQDEDHTLDGVLNKALEQKPDVDTPQVPEVTEEDDKKKSRGVGSIKSQMKRYLK